MSKEKGWKIEADELLIPRRDLNFLQLTFSDCESGKYLKGEWSVIKSILSEAGLAIVRKDTGEEI